MSKLHNIQLLRAVAALMVVCIHLDAMFSKLGVLIPDAGVDLFFVISGFIMVQVSSNTLPRMFFARRLIRVVPLYWTMTFLIFICAAIAPSLFVNTSADFISLVKSLLFIPFAKSDVGMAQPLLFVGWTLNYEIFFYILFSIGLIIGRHGVIAVTAVLAALVSIGFLFQPQGVIEHFYTSPLLLEFALGMWVSRVMEHRTLTANQAFATLMFALPFALYGDRFIPTIDRTFSLGFPAAVLLAAAVSLDRRGLSLPSLSPLGDASYAIYLAHPFITGLAIAVMKHLPDSRITAAVLCFAALAITIVIGLLIYRFFERPLTVTLNDRAKSKGSLASSAP